MNLKYLCVVLLMFLLNPANADWRTLEDYPLPEGSFELNDVVTSQYAQGVDALIEADALCKSWDDKANLPDIINWRHIAHAWKAMGLKMDHCPAVLSVAAGECQQDANSMGCTKDGSGDSGILQVDSAVALGAEKLYNPCRNVFWSIKILAPPADNAATRYNKGCIVMGRGTGALENEGDLPLLNPWNFLTDANVANTNYQVGSQDHEQTYNNNGISSGNPNFIGPFCHIQVDVDGGNHCCAWTGGAVSGQNHGFPYYYYKQFLGQAHVGLSNQCANGDKDACQTLSKKAYKLAAGYCVDAENGKLDDPVPESQFRCGTSWTNSLESCVMCPGGESTECPNGQTCYDNVPQGSCPSQQQQQSADSEDSEDSVDSVDSDDSEEVVNNGPAVWSDLTEARCGNTWTHALQQCVACPNGQGDCPNGQTCFGGVQKGFCTNYEVPTGTYNTATHARCGISWNAALGSCTTCVNWQCANGQSCFGGVPVGYCSIPQCSLEEDCVAANTESVSGEKGSCKCQCKSGFTGDKCETASQGGYSTQTHNRCGSTWTHATQQCVQCPNGLNSDCPSGQFCYAGVTVGHCPNNRRTLFSEVDDSTAIVVNVIIIVANIAICAGLVACCYFCFVKQRDPVVVSVAEQRC